MFARCLAIASARVEPAELVHEPDLSRLPPRPDAPLPDRVDALRRRVPPLRRLLDERVVGGLHVLRDTARAPRA